MPLGRKAKGRRREEEEDKVRRKKRKEATGEKEVCLCSLLVAACSVVRGGCKREVGGGKVGA